MSTAEKLIKLGKWGSGMGVLIPAALANQLKVSPGDQMRLVLDGQSILITPVKKKKSLAERFAEYDGPLRLTEEWDFEPEGNELDW
ncbi:AbrB/MazE/SpoVT family DNA-binding domain-containing protein [Allobaculum sp. JKK-2023]|uniref:AbrB/MazE/SpoVT family DNA-binding domain-containing protein n=1 Tax=Allobaculum sp. JKK-2023 TaxID=3108943 RepID=UPI002B059502|nr:AbrB/MazE/SpoVT family DNA-binding domain-containing protein [Allobaculum sp. JKK-2023]